MPDSLLLVILVAVGLCVGVLVNQAIASWRFDGPLLIGPYGKVPDGAQPRKWFHYLPVVGWLTRTSDASVIGKRFWLRPFLLELSIAVWMPLLFAWIRDGGLIEQGVSFQVTQSQALTWFIPQAIMISLLMIATFIDFDERIIPDQVTIPGTLVALLIAWIVPAYALPITKPEAATNKQVIPLRFDFPGADPIAMVASNGRLAFELQQLEEAEADRDLSSFQDDMKEVAWLCGRKGLLLNLLLLWAWCFALTPKTIDWRYGIGAGFQYMIASILRPARKSKPKRKFKPQPRKMMFHTKLLFVVGVVGSLLIGLAWMECSVRWYSLTSAMIGMAFGGLTVWLVRIVGTFALQQEAMGFGDVTLLAMIGAFLGWQPALLVFSLAPFTAVFVALAQFVITRSHELAFGPYLSLGAVVLVLSWARLWNAWAGPSVFMMGSLLLWILVIASVLMFVMLFVYRLVQPQGPAVDGESE